ncbi:hypothetical protein PUN28_001979 [Cardiocondyla obscurior]|uniref:Uncharacterized protein n=1 Tax=Cardiocondyla obscurior TaxID=286306 RepID=A0AAW2GS44_9HYME
MITRRRYINIHFCKINNVKFLCFRIIIKGEKKKERKDEDRCKRRRGKRIAFHNLSSQLPRPGSPASFPNVALTAPHLLKVSSCRTFPYFTWTTVMYTLDDSRDVLIETVSFLLNTNITKMKKNKRNYFSKESSLI